MTDPDQLPEQAIAVLADEWPVSGRDLAAMYRHEPRIQTRLQRLRAQGVDAVDLRALRREIMLAQLGELECGWVWPGGGQA